MRITRIILLCATMPFFAACGGNDSCDDFEHYQSARLADPLVVPDDLDALPANKALIIPEPSPRPERAADAGCLDEPPKI